MVFSLAGGASAVNFSVGPKEVLYSSKEKKSKKLTNWPDGNLGVVRNAQGGYEFYAANGGSPTKTVGSLTNPGASKQSVSITNLPRKKFDYVAGGPVYQDPATGTRLMIYHAETHGKSAKKFYGTLGMAVSTDPRGLQFRDLGLILQPNLPDGTAEIGGGTFAVMGDYFHVYYRDMAAAGGASELAVARAPMSELISNAVSGRGTSFTKYYEGSWSQSGLGGMASPLEAWNPSNLWTSVSHNDYLNELVMVTSEWSPTQQPNLAIATSPDGINWSTRQPLVADVGEQFYPTLIGTGADPTRTGQSFYVYYTDSKQGGWNRWKDGQLVRREITLDPLYPPTEPVPPILPMPLPGALDPPGGPEPTDPSSFDWATVAEYGADFQLGGPADGWSYMWNPNGKRTNSAAFEPLQWSESAQAYNTTGGVIRTPGKSNHDDDYLTLTANGGHPGRPDYATIVGYTIQEDDGAGLYRLAETSIRKADGLQSSKEDGLGLMVYVNSALAGYSNVSTDGLLTEFDRGLGQLDVGDTVWVMVDPLKNQAYDTFADFNFAIQKSFHEILESTAVQRLSQMSSVAVVPEPGGATLALIASVGSLLLSRRQIRTLRR